MNKKFRFNESTTSILFKYFICFYLFLFLNDQERFYLIKSYNYLKNNLVLLKINISERDHPNKKNTSKNIQVRS